MLWALPVKLAAGDRVDRFIVLGPVGLGAAASVYAAQHQLLETVHALKLLRAPMHGMVERLLREGRLQAQLVSDHVVPVHDAVRVGDSVALVMPLVAGGSLADLLAEHVPSEAEALTLFAGVVEGVGVAHAAGIAHRDLKPANVLLDVQRGAVFARVADFGIAKVLHDPGAGHTDGFVGTEGYAAPEQWADPAAVDHRADFWALGALLYELLCGQRPFGETPGRRDRAEAQDWDRDAVPARWQGLIAQLLDPDPARRVSSAPLIRQALAHAVDGSTLPLASGVGRVVAARVEAASPVPMASPARDDPSTLPRERTPIVGRDAELATLEALVGSGVVTTLRGPAGVGKTRLALRLAHIHQGRGDVVFCDLEGTCSLADVAAAVGAAVGATGRGPDLAGRIGAALARRDAPLVVLDNAEPVAEPVAGMVTAWIDAAPDARWLVTSRVPLGLPEERVLVLEPLPLAAATALFVTRARASDASFSVDPSDEDALKRVVELLDRLPLAIELGAARSGLLGLDGLARQLADRFRVLASPGPGRTLRAALDSSWSCITPEARAALAQLSVFRGPLDLEAAEAVVDAGGRWVGDALQQLVDHSLLVVRSPGWFELLLSVRDFGAEHLERVSEVEARHGDHYARWGAPDALRAMQAHGGGDLRKHVAQHTDNLVVACRRAIARGDATVAVGVLRALQTIVQRRPIHEVLEALCEAADAVVPSDTAQEVDVLTIWSQAIAQRRGPADARPLVARALRAADASGSAEAQARAHGHAGSLAIMLRDWAAAEHHLGAAARLGRELGRPGFAARMSANLGQMLVDTDRPSEATEHFEAAIEVLRAEGDRVNEGIVHLNLGRAHAHVGRDDESEACFGAAQRLAAEAGTLLLEGNAAGHRATLAAKRGAWDDAEALNEHRMALAHATETTWPLVSGRLLSARIHLARGQVQDAIQVARQAGDRGAATGYQDARWRGREVEGRALAGAGRLDEARARLTEGLDIATGLDSTIGAAHLSQALGDVLLDHDPGLAEAHYAHAALAARRGASPWQEVRAILGSAEVHRRLGALEEARRAVRRARDVAHPRDVASHRLVDALEAAIDA